MFGFMHEAGHSVFWSQMLWCIWWQPNSPKSVFPSGSPLGDLSCIGALFSQMGRPRVAFLNQRSLLSPFHCLSKSPKVAFLGFNCLLKNWEHCKVSGFRKPDTLPSEQSTPKCLFWSQMLQSLWLYEVRHSSFMKPNAPERLAQGFFQKTLRRL